MTKTCTKCLQDKPLVDFHRDGRSADGYRAQCAECRKTSVHEWYERTKEVRRAKDQARRLRPEFKTAKQEYMKKYIPEYRAKTPNSSEKSVSAARKWQMENPEKVLAAELKRRNGIDVDTYKAMVEAQGGNCAICNEEPEDHRLAVDHCHKTDKVRGLLCRRCNVGIGNLRDNVSLVFAAAAYLLEYEDVLEEMNA